MNSNFIALAFCFFATASATEISIPYELNSVISFLLPALNGVIEDSLPYSVGNCDDPSAPESCIELGDGPIKSFDFKVLKGEIQWVGGINTIEFQNVNVGSFDDRNLRIQVELTVDELPLQIKAKFCVWKCYTALNDDKTCCGMNKKTIKMVVKVPCSDEAPHFGAPILEDISITPNIYLRPWGKFRLLKLNGLVTKYAKEAAANAISPEIIALINQYVTPILNSGPKTCAMLKP